MSLSKFINHLIAFAARVVANKHRTYTSDYWILSQNICEACKGAVYFINFELWIQMVAGFCIGRK